MKRCIHTFVLARNTFDYELFDIQGKILNTGQVDAESSLELVSDFLPKGVSLLKIKNKEGVFTIKKVLKVE